jgi:hypothetical protein
MGRLVRIVCDQRKACFEVHLILAINLQTARSPGDCDLVEDNPPPNERRQPDFGADVFDIDGYFKR